MIKTGKKPESVKVDMDFLMKMANQIDTLTAQVEELSKPKDSIKGFDTNATYDTPLNYNLADHQKEFIGELTQLLVKYKVLKLRLTFSK